MTKETDEKIIPAVALRDSVVFPNTEFPLTFGRPRSNSAVKAAFAGSNDRLMAVFAQKEINTVEPGKNDLYEIGTLISIENIFETEGTLAVIARGIARIRLEEVVQTEPYLLVRISQIPEIIEDSDEVKALSTHLLNEYRKAFNLGKPIDVMSLMKLSTNISPVEITDHISSNLDIKTEEKQKLLETPVVKERLLKVSEYLGRENKVLEIERSISTKTQEKFEKEMKEAVLRERKKTIERELGEMDGSEDEQVKEIKRKIAHLELPIEVKKKVEKELKRYAEMPAMNPERSYLENWLDWIVGVPWCQKSPNNTSISKAAQILENDHYGLKKIKERIIEYLAVMKLKNKKLKGEDKKEAGTPSILCFMGPPGVGKTSIGKSIAKALGRKFIRMSLGGIRDEAEIRGHRRTYVGAMPGRIIQGMKTAGTKNPVFMLDEIDKIGTDFRGDPSSALLEALDPEQNKEFSDHYLEVPYDLSEVLFICTGNMLDTIPPALLDRLEVIDFPGYTEDEKYHIAKDFLWKKQLEASGLDKLKITQKAVYEIIRHYTREAGVRELERMLAMILRKIARKTAEGKNLDEKIEETSIRKFLGPEKYSATLAEKKNEIGISTGLAWTQAGGDILFIEVALMPGKGQLLLTGHLGDVMKESAQAAFTYARSHYDSLGLKANFAKDLDVHVHVPEGAVPKDGPSAGVAMTVALVSALTKTPTDREVGMTGEITLRGRVLEIGGVKEKVIAAHRAGLKTIILPKDNKKDLEDVPSNVKKDIKFVYVSDINEALKVALSPQKK